MNQNLNNIPVSRAISDSVFQELRVNIGEYIIRISEAQFEIPINVEAGLFSLFVTLDPGFPSIAPRIYISPNVTHYLFPNGRDLRHQLIDRWSTSSYVKDVVKDVHFKLLSHLMSIKKDDINNPHLEPEYSIPRNNNNDSKYQGYDDVRIDTQKLTVDYFRLNELSIEELRKLEQDNKSLENFCRELPKVKEMIKERELLEKKAEEIAKETLGMEVKYQECVEELKKAFEELEIAKKKYENTSKNLREAQQNRTPSAMIDRMRIAAQDCDEEAEELYNSFCEGSIQLEKFISDYKKMRITYHSRNIKVERIQESLLIN